MAGDDKVVHVWMTDERRHRIEAEICAMSGDGITRKEWAHLPQLLVGKQA